MIKLAVLLTGSNHIVTIIEGSNVVYAARKADGERGINHTRSFKEVPKDQADAEYAVYVLDDSDAKFITTDVDRFVDPKYFNYVRVNCPHKASLALG